MLLRTRTSQIPLFSRKSSAQSRYELPTFSKFCCCEYVPSEKNNTKMTTVTRYFSPMPEELQNFPECFLSRVLKSNTNYKILIFLLKIVLFQKVQMDTPNAVFTTLWKTFLTKSNKCWLEIGKNVEKLANFIMKLIWDRFSGNAKGSFHNAVEMFSPEIGVIFATFLMHCC